MRMFVACWALGKIGHRQAVPHLIQTLGDRNANVRRVACWALGKIGHRQAVPHLIQTLGDRMRMFDGSHAGR
jgi:HEAT repeat protein